MRLAFEHTGEILEGELVSFGVCPPFQDETGLDLDLAVVHVEGPQGRHELLINKDHVDGLAIPPERVMTIKGSLANISGVYRYAGDNKPTDMLKPLPALLNAEIQML